MENLAGDTTQKPAMAPTQTMRCHCDQGIIALFLSIGDDLCCQVSIQNFRMYIYPPTIRKPPGYALQVVLRPCHLLFKPVLGEFYAHKPQRGNGRNDVQKSNPGGVRTRKSGSMRQNSLC